MSQQPSEQPALRAVVRSESLREGDETGAGLMRSRCAFTSQDMGADWATAFTYAIVSGWGGEDDPDGINAWPEVAAKWGWDDTLVGFLKDAHDRFTRLADRSTPVVAEVDRVDRRPERWLATLVHGNDDEAVGEFDSLEEAARWARAQESLRHPDSHGVFGKGKFSSESDGFVQFGTGYHWVTLERLDPPRPNAIPAVG